MRKKCCRCSQNKPLKDFNKDCSTKDGLDYRCKVCARLRVQKYHTENRNKDNARRSRWLLTNNGKTFLKRQRNRIVKQLRDHYIANRFKLSVTKIPSTLIEAKREQIKLKRYIKEIEK